MEDKTPMYMLAIVLIVAVVGIISMMIHSVPESAETNNNMMTGNVVIEQAPSFTSFGKVFFVVFLAGIAGYMYFSEEQ